MKKIDVINIFNDEMKGIRKITKIVKYKDGYLILGDDPKVEEDDTGNMFYINADGKMKKIFYPEDFEGISKALGY